METSEKKEGSMDMRAMMEAYAKFGKPGAQHKMLETMAGSWETKVKTWPQPGMPPMESTGSSQAKMIMGGRFLQDQRAAARTHAGASKQKINCIFLVSASFLAWQRRLATIVWISCSDL